MKYLALLLFCLPLLAQDAVNPCAVNTRSLDCSAPDGPAEAEFRQIKLNGRRKEDPTVAAGEDLVLAATLKYTKRAHAVVTTTFTGSGGSTCPDRIENQRLKPELDVTYSAALTITGSTLNFSGSGLEFTIPGSALSGASAAVLTVTFTVTGSSAPGCLATPYPSMTKVFTLLVDDGSFYGEIIAENDDEADDTDYSDAKRMPPVVPEHSYFLVDQDRKIKFTANFTTLGGATAADDEIHWSVTPASAGTFTNGATGKTVKFRQGAYQSLALDDVVVRAEGPDNTTVTFKLSYISVDPLEVQMSTSETRQFVVPEVNIHPTTADKSIIVGLLGQPEIVGNKFNGVRLRTREHSGLALASESFVPGEALQWAHTGRVLLRGTYLHIANTLVLEVTSSSDEGTYNLSWEIKRLFHSERRFLHHAVVQVEDVPLPTTLTLVKDGTSDTGPFPLGLDGAQLHMRALTSGGTFASGFPTWAIQAPPGSSITPPPAGTDHANFLFDKPGTYTFTVTENGQTDQAVVLVYGIDLDADSDNDNGLANPAGSPAEDLVENSSPGKILIASLGDTDGDLIPDFADGFDFDAGAAAKDDASTHNFVPLVLRLPEPTDPAVARIRFDYEGAAPLLTMTTDNDPLLPHFSSAAPLHPLRLWRKDGNQPRNAHEVPAGDFIESITYFNASDLGFTNNNREVVLYLESIGGSTTWGDQSVEVLLDYDGIGPTPYIHSDSLVFSSVSVKVTPLSLLRTGVAHTLTATALPAGGNFAWALTQGAARATVTGPLNTDTLQVTANQHSENLGDIVATVAYTAPVPGGTPATVVQMAVPLPAYYIGFIRDNGNANPNDDASLSYLDVSNERTIEKISPTNGHTDIDNFKLQVSGPLVDASIPEALITLEALKPDATPFSTARTQQKNLTRVASTHHYRSDYMRLVVDKWDRDAKLGQTILIDWDSSDHAVEILGQKVKLTYTPTPNFSLETQLPVGHNPRTFNVAVHWMTGITDVTSASATWRVLRDMRRRFAQANMGPILDSVDEIAPPHNFIAISQDTGNPAAGGGTFHIKVIANRGVYGLVTWNIASASVASRSPFATAGQLRTALQAAAPTSGGSPGDRLVVSRFQNHSVFAADATHQSADLLITDPGGGTITLIVSDSDATQHLSAPPVTTSMLAWGANNFLIGSVEQRSLIRNFDRGTDIYDLFVSESITDGNGDPLKGASMIWGSGQPSYRQGNDPIRHNVFITHDGADTAGANPSLSSHEVGHSLLDAIHAVHNNEQVMKDTDGNQINSESGSKRFADRSIYFDSEHVSTAGVYINQVTRMRSSAMTFPGKRRSEEDHLAVVSNHLPPPALTEGPLLQEVGSLSDEDHQEAAEPDPLDRLLSSHGPRSRAQAMHMWKDIPNKDKLGADLGQKLFQDQDDTSLSKVLRLIAKLRLDSQRENVWTFVTTPGRPLNQRLLGLRVLLQLESSTRVHREVSELIGAMASFTHTQRVQVVELTWYQDIAMARQSLAAIGALAGEAMTRLQTKLATDALPELGSWGDIHNRVLGEMRTVDLLERRSNELMELYLEQATDRSIRNRVLSGIFSLHLEAAILAKAQQLQGSLDEIGEIRLLSLRDALFDALDENQVQKLEEGGLSAPD